VQDNERLLTKYRITPSGCWEWTGGTNQYGYGLIALTVSGRRTSRATHRHQWICAHGPIPPGQHVMHTCDNRLCINLDHLRLGSPKDNIRDMMKKGRQDFSGLRNADSKRDLNWSSADPFRKKV
jgi:hypothetical protein